MYGLELVHMHSNWFEISFYISKISKYLTLFLPITIVFIFLDKMVRLISVFVLIVLLFILIYGFIYIGFFGMFSNTYVKLTILFLLGVIAMLYVYNRIKKF